MKIKVSEATGAVLDWTVAKCEGYQGRFTKKPVTIDAWLIDFGNKPLPDWVNAGFLRNDLDWSPDGEGLYINTLEGCMLGSNGDYLIQGVKGELYACKPDIFAATYAPASLSTAAAQPPVVEKQQLDVGLIDLEWREIQRTDDSWQSQPHRRLASWAFQRGVAAAPKAEPVQPFAWATFDGEGNYDLRLYEGNESYRDDYIKRNGQKYAGWVAALYEQSSNTQGA